MVSFYYRLNLVPVIVPLFEGICVFNFFPTTYLYISASLNIEYQINIINPNKNDRIIYISVKLILT